MNFSEKQIKDIDMKECTCGNEKFNLDCICEWVENHPGDTEYCCIWCGIYTASDPRCSDCEEC